MSDKPLSEPEVFVSNVGCPFKIGDPRAIDWLDGYRAGLREGAQIGLDALDRLNKRLDNSPP